RRRCRRWMTSCIGPGRRWMRRRLRPRRGIGCVACCTGVASVPDFAWPWIFLALPLPWLAWRWLPAARPTRALRMPFDDVSFDEAAAGRAWRGRAWVLALAWLLLVAAAEAMPMPEPM